MQEIDSQIIDLFDEYKEAVNDNLAIGDNLNIAAAILTFTHILNEIAYSLCTIMEK